jgi:hypothetical protein
VGANRPVRALQREVALSHLLPLAGLALLVPLRIPLRYESRLVTADFPNPATRLTIDGRSAWFLFDTGAGVHVVASWYANAAGLTIEERLDDTVHGRDSTGRPLRFRGVRAVTAQLDDTTPLTLAQAAVGDFPPEFERSQIGGVISPQLLAGPGEAAVLDLRIPELRLEPEGVALSRLGARWLPREQVRTCGSAGAAVPNLVYAVAATVAGRAGALVLDTGAKATTVRANSALARGLRRARGGHTTGLSGRGHAYSVARRTTVALAGGRHTIDVRIADVAASPCRADGLVGLDVLRACALVLAPEDVAIVCGP